MSATINHQLSKRSLLVVYTSFDSLHAMERQLPYLQMLNKRHRVLLVFFIDNEKQQLLKTKAHTTEEYYQHVIVEKMMNEQHLIISQLRRHGIQSLLTTPQNLSADVVNRYLEMKARHAI